MSIPTVVAVAPKDAVEGLRSLGSSCSILPRLWDASWRWWTKQFWDSPPGNKGTPGINVYTFTWVFLGGGLEFLLIWLVLQVWWEFWSVVVVFGCLSPAVGVHAWPQSCLLQGRSMGSSCRNGLMLGLCKYCLGIFVVAIFSFLTPWSTLTRKSEWREGNGETSKPVVSELR